MTSIPTQELNRSINLPLVSVIMNCFNCEKYLRDAINSVYAQTYKNWEIIFWDNASADGSAVIAGSYDEHLRYFRGEETITLGAARNKALEQVQGEFIAFLDCDDLWMPDKLENQINLMVENDQVILCYSDGYYIYDNKYTKVRFSEALNTKFHRGDVFRKLICGNFINWQTVIISKKLGGKNIYFNDTLEFAEDHDLLLRMSLIGKFDYISTPLVYYREHSGNMTRKVDLILRDNNIICNLYKKQIEEHNINFKDIVASKYGAIVIILIRQNEIIKAEEYSRFLLKYCTFSNMIIYLLVKLKLTFLFKPNIFNKLRKAIKLFMPIFCCLSLFIS